jgi:type 1 glutamine amidotransferase
MFAQATAVAVAEKPAIKVLIVDGYGNHDWRRTTRLIRGVLDQHGGFAVEVSTAPARSDDPAYAGWRPTFGGFDVVVQTCNDINGSGPLWPEQVRRDFETWVRSGGGVFFFHAANNAFPTWEAYDLMIGLGWRPATHGTAIRINQDGSLEEIPPGSGRATHHGPRSDRTIHRLGDHPVHTGLPRTWMTPLVEVYTHARGPAQDLEVLSWAADPTSGERWPVEWAVRHGKGRVYTSTFGHVWKDEEDPVNMRCAGFQTIMVRALQWLAGHDVDHALPADFPGAATISLRPAHER